TLEVEERSGTRKLEIGSLPCLAQQIKLDQLAFRARHQFCNRQTTAVDCHAVADFQSADAHPRAHGKSNGTGRGFDALDDACFFDDPRKHDAAASFTLRNWSSTGACAVRSVWRPARRLGLRGARGQ